MIPPLAGSAAPQEGFLTDLIGINLLDWAALAQDVVFGLQALPSDLGSHWVLGVVNLLQLREAATGVVFCHFCCHLEPRCLCVGASQSAPSTSWNQVVEQTPGYGVTASSRGVTTPSTSMGGMPGYVAPLPGLTPLDFSIWSLPPLEASLPKGLPTSLQYAPPIGRSAQMGDALNRRAQAQQAQTLQALALHAPVLQAPRMAPPICQPLPCWPATLYQQAVQLPSKSTGLGVTFDSSTDKPAPTGSQDAEGRGRQST